MTEILPNMNDIGNRYATTEELTRFKGIPQEVLCISDDKNRLAILYGDRVNHYEKTILFSDLTEATLEACLKLLKYTYLYKELNIGSFVLDTNSHQIFDLVLRHNIELTLNSDNIDSNQTKEITVIISNTANYSLRFTNSIRWIGNEPEFSTATGSKYLIKFYFTSTGWIGEYRASTDLSEGTEESELVNITEEDRQVMHDISQNIDDIRAIASHLSTVTNLENNINDLIAVGRNTTQLLRLAESMTVLTELSTSLNTILQVQPYLNMIATVAHHLKDKYFLDVKVTEKKIDGNIILPLDKIILAPTEDVSSASGSSGNNIDTDSSDGTISPSLLVWSDEDLSDNLVGDGVIVVSPTRNKINSVNVKE